MSKTILRITKILIIVIRCCTTVMYHKYHSFRRHLKFKSPELQRFGCVRHCDAEVIGLLNG